MQQPPPPSPERLVLTGIGLLTLGVASWMAYRAVGGLGIVILGLFVLFVSVRLDLDGDRAVGPQMTPGLYASQHHLDNPADTAERGLRRQLLAGLASWTKLAALAGGALVLIGGGLMWLA